MKFPFYFQLEAKDCGPACIRMVAAYYGKKYSLHKLKEICNLSRQGATVLDVVECLKKNHFSASPITISLPELKRMPLPSILHWRQDHYVVLFNIDRDKNYYWIADPAFGKMKMDESELLENWISNDVGVTIALKPNSNFENYLDDEDNTERTSKKIFNLLVSNIDRNRKSMIFIFFLLSTSLIFSWLSPVIFQKTIDNGVLKENLSVVFKMTLFQLLFFVGYTLSSGVSNIILSKINLLASIKYLTEYLYKLVQLPLKFFDTRLNTDLIQRLADQERLQKILVFSSVDSLLVVLNIVVFSSILLYYSVESFFIFFIISLISITWTLLFLKKRRRLDYKRFSIASQNQNSIYELIFGMSEIKINNAHNNMIAKWENVRNLQNRVTLESLYLNYYQSVGSAFVNRVRDILIILLCAYYVISSEMTLGILMTISYILGLLSAPMSQLIQLTRTAQDAANSLDRLNEIQLMPNEDNDKKEQASSPIKKGLAFSNVSFKYTENSNRFIISDVNFEIPQGKITAIVGASGSGKTTLLKLLLSFYYPQKGGIYLDDIELNKINAGSWRKLCGCVMQNGYIFSGSIAENIALADTIPDMDRVVYAARQACIDRFVSMLPNGYNTKIGKIGIDLSGGQTQRILIARAVYNNPQVIILDEATSSLDANNEKQILNNLNDFFKGKTVIIVAHRLSTVKNADNIIVLDGGKIVEKGDHEKLSQDKGYYYELIKNQLELGL